MTNVLMMIHIMMTMSIKKDIDEGTDVIPVFVIVLFVSLAEACQLLGNLLADVFGNLLNKAVVLKS